MTLLLLLLWLWLTECCIIATVVVAVRGGREVGVREDPAQPPRRGSRQHEHEARRREGDLSEGAERDAQHHEDDAAREPPVGAVLQPQHRREQQHEGRAWFVRSFVRSFMD